MNGVAVSIVSHGHGSQLLPLLQRIAREGSRVRRVWLTFDIPDPQWQSALCSQIWPFDLRLRNNSQSRSFAENHNQAFRAEQHLGEGIPDYWWVLNPDVTWNDLILEKLIPYMTPSDVGLVCPRQLDLIGNEQDFARELPTPTRIFYRILCRLMGRGGRPHKTPDWVNGACMLVRGSAYDAIGGFDEKYRLYVEDVDFCLRLQLAGYSIGVASDVIVQHVGQRRSRYSLRHAVWHISGLCRLWRSEVYRQYQSRRRHKWSI